MSLPGPRPEVPMIAGFSEGAITATIAAIRHPGAMRALVNHAGYDAFSPQAQSLQIMRQWLGGSPEATSADTGCSTTAS